MRKLRAGEQRYDSIKRKTLPAKRTAEQACARHGDRCRRHGVACRMRSGCIAPIDASDLGHPYGLEVTVVDFDAVSQANVGRARFYESDCGQNKAQVLTNRINLCYGLDFKAVSGKVEERSDLRQMDIIIGCVDTRESRRAISESRTSAGAYWCDIGNGAYDGQVILGQLPGSYPRGVQADQEALRLPTVVDLYPEMLDAGLDPKDLLGLLQRVRRFANSPRSSTSKPHYTLCRCSLRFSRMAAWITPQSFSMCRVGEAAHWRAPTPAAWRRFGYGSAKHSEKSANVD